MGRDGRVVEEFVKPRAGCAGGGRRESVQSKEGTVCDFEARLEGAGLHPINDTVESDMIARKLVEMRVKTDEFWL